MVFQRSLSQNAQRINLIPYIAKSIVHILTVFAICLGGVHSISLQIHVAFNFHNLSICLSYRFRQRLRISHDSLYNLHELAYDLDDFVHKIITYPDLIVISGMKKMLTEMNIILASAGQGSQLLSYDTTFKLGDFYISPFLFRNTLFKKNPVMPAFFMIHERKLKSTHEELMKLIAVALPGLVNGSHTIPCVTDDEKGFEVIDKYLPQVRRFQCWNHIINSSKNWLKNHGASSAEVPIYVGNIRDLLCQKSEVDYSSRLGELKVKWSQPFLQYYMKEIHDKVHKKHERINLLLYHVYPLCNRLIVLAVGSLKNWVCTML